MGANDLRQGSLFGESVDSLALIEPAGGGERPESALTALDLKRLPEFGRPTAEKIDRATSALKAVLRAGRPLAVAYSGGKDSTCALSLALNAAAELKAEGASLPPIIVTHANTGIENPAYQAVINSEIGRIRSFAAERGLPVRVDIASPTLNDSWAVRIISGRALPTFPNSATRDCTVNWKIQPQTRQRKEVLKDLGERGRPVTVIGTRFEESPSRAKRMLERGESAESVWVQETIGADGRLAKADDMLSPLAFWTQEDVWVYLSDLSEGIRPSYTDAKDVWEAYRDGGGSGCAVVADDAMKANAKACGARFGCSLCVAVGRDKSLEAMIESDPKYGFMRGLNRLQRFLSDTQYDLDRRLWLGRSINEQGYIAIGPDAYGPSMQRELLRYALTIDRDERQAAEGLGIGPRFQLVTAEQLIAIDAIWSCQGYHLRPFEAIRIWREIDIEGASFYPPEIGPKSFRERKMPPTRYLHVGASWDGRPRSEAMYSGLRDVVGDLVGTYETGGCVGHRELPDGRIVMDMAGSDLFSVDPEGAGLFLEFEVLEGGLLERYANCPDPVEAYRHYVRLGTLSTNTRHLGTIDDMLRRTSWKKRAGALDWGVEDLLERSVSKSEMLAGVREPSSRRAWREDFARAEKARGKRSEMAL